MEMNNLALDDLNWHALHGGRDVIHQSAALFGVQQAEQVARLGVIIISCAVIVTVRITGDLQWRFPVFRRLGWATK